MACNRISNPFNRRHFLSTAGAGFGAVALSALTNEPLLAEASANPTLPKIPHRWGKAKRHFSLHGGRPQPPDLFDPKPLLNKLADQPFPEASTGPSPQWGSELSPARIQKTMEAAWGKWSLVFRPVAQSQSHCRRALRNPFLRIRRDQSCRRSLSDEHRFGLRRTPLTRFLGILWAWHQNQVCPASSSSRIPAPWWSMERDGATGSCPHPTKECF